MRNRGTLATIVGILVLGPLALPNSALAGPTAAAKCEAVKNQTAGKYAACVSKAKMKLAITAGLCSVETSTICYRDDDCPGVASGETCAKDTATYEAALVKCEDQFSGKWGKAETKAGGACPTNLDQSDIESQTAAGADLLAWQLSNTARYFDNRDGTITDRKTGLVWEKKVAWTAVPHLEDLHDADNTYLWSGTCSISGEYCQPTAEASEACTRGIERSAPGCAECAGGGDTCSATDTVWTWLVALNAAGLGGESDWRIPTLEELLSTVDYEVIYPAVDDAFKGDYCGATCTDITDPDCSCTVAGLQYWSASPLPTWWGQEWVVNFAEGQSDLLYATTTGTFDLGLVRAVRGGS